MKVSQIMLQEYERIIYVNWDEIEKHFVLTEDSENTHTIVTEDELNMLWDELSKDGFLYSRGITYGFAWIYKLKGSAE